MTSLLQTSQHAVRFVLTPVNWGMAAFNSTVGHLSGRAAHARAFESQVQSLESKLALTEIFPIQYSGNTPLYLRYLREIGSSSIATQSETFGSIARLAYMQLVSLKSMTSHPQDIQRISDAMKINQSLCELSEHEPSQQELVRQDRNQAMGEQANLSLLPLSSENISRQIENARILVEMKKAEREFCRIFPNEASMLKYSVGLQLNYRSNRYDVRLEIRGINISANFFRQAEHLFCDPFRPEELEKAIVAGCGVYNQYLMSGDGYE